MTEINKVYMLCYKLGMDSDLDIIGIYRKKSDAEAYIHDVGFGKIKFRSPNDVDNYWIEEHNLK